MNQNIKVQLQQNIATVQLKPFAKFMQPIIAEALAENNKDKYRKGTILTPVFLVWIILTLTLRRDYSYPKIVNWLLSGKRWTTTNLPANILECGAISRARVKLGVSVFRDIFYNSIAQFKKIKPDFHGLTTVAFDGTALTMPDTEKNCEEFRKHESGRGKSAFPQMRVVALMALSHRLIIDVAYAAIKGKKTGERTLMMEILEKVNRKNLLFLFDAGFYSFALAKYLIDNNRDFIMKMSKSTNLPVRPGSRMSDGSYLSIIGGKIEIKSESKGKRKKWKKVSITVRVIIFQVPGFRPVRLITTLLDPSITDREIILHYHKRWDIEISYDEIKTHQCATLKGHESTIFRSKRPDLVKQELYAMITTYNLVRELIVEASNKHNVDPLHISFLDTLQWIIESCYVLSITNGKQIRKKIDYLRRMISESLIDRPRRHRSNPRVVKIKMSNYKRKRETDRSKSVNFANNIELLSALPIC
jgi:hypothetical protein